MPAKFWSDERRYGQLRSKGIPDNPPLRTSWGTVVAFLLLGICNLVLLPHCVTCWWQRHRPKRPR